MALYGGYSAKLASNFKIKAVKEGGKSGNAISISTVGGVKCDNRFPFPDLNFA